MKRKHQLKRCLNPASPMTCPSAQEIQEHNTVPATYHVAMVFLGVY